MSPIHILMHSSSERGRSTRKSFPEVSASNGTSANNKFVQQTLNGVRVRKAPCRTLRAEGTLELLKELLNALTPPFKRPPPRALFTPCHCLTLRAGSNYGSLSCFCGLTGGLIPTSTPK